MRKSCRLRLQEAAQALRRELRVYQLAVRDPRTPRAAKVLLWAAITYALLPFDLIPDFIPVIGHVDDLVIVPGLAILALKLIPRELIEELRAQCDVAGQPR